jgi:hypothetical protein
MSTSPRAIKQAGANLAWRQWASLGVLGDSQEPESRCIDIEALLWFTYVPGGADARRLQDAVADWLRINGDLVSLHRIRNVHRSDPVRLERVTELLRGSSAVPPGRVDRTTKATRADPLIPANLAVRLRLTFDAGVRAEILRYLLTTSEPHLDVLTIAEVTSFSKRNVNDILLSLVSARMLEQTWEANRRAFSIDRDRWWRFLGVEHGARPGFVPWLRSFRAMREINLWLATDRTNGRSAYLRSSDARDLLTRIGDDLTASGISVPDLQRIAPDEVASTLEGVLVGTVRFAQT